MSMRAPCKIIQLFGKRGGHPKIHPPLFKALLGRNIKISIHVWFQFESYLEIIFFVSDIAENANGEPGIGKIFIKFINNLAGGKRKYKKLNGMSQTSEINPAIISGNKITVLQIFFLQLVSENFSSLEG